MLSRDFLQKIYESHEEQKTNPKKDILEINRIEAEYEKQLAAELDKAVVVTAENLAESFQQTFEEHSALWYLTNIIVLLPDLYSEIILNKVYQKLSEFILSKCCALIADVHMNFTIDYPQNIFRIAFIPKDNSAELLEENKKINRKHLVQPFHALLKGFVNLDLSEDERIVRANPLNLSGELKTKKSLLVDFNFYCFEQFRNIDLKKDFLKIIKRVKLNDHNSLTEDNMLTKKTLPFLDVLQSYLVMSDIILKHYQNLSNTLAGSLQAPAIIPAQKTMQIRNLNKVTAYQDFLKEMAIAKLWQQAIRADIYKLKKAALTKQTTTVVPLSLFNPKRSAPLVAPVVSRALPQLCTKFTS